MRYLIASDLHGSAKYCRALLEALRRESAGRLVLLGDLLYHGPRNDFPEEYDTRAVTALLNSVSPSPLCVRGNCDAEVDQMVLSFPILADCCFLESGPASVCATHGHVYGPETPPPLAEGSFLLCGHTHLPVRRDCGTFTYVNPGSLALPKDGTPHSYLTLEEGVFTWHELMTGDPFTPLP